MITDAQTSVTVKVNITVEDLYTTPVIPTVPTTYSMYVPTLSGSLVSTYKL